MELVVCWPGQRGEGNELGYFRRGHRLLWGTPLFLHVISFTLRYVSALFGFQEGLDQGRSLHLTFHFLPFCSPPHCFIPSTFQNKELWSRVLKMACWVGFRSTSTTHHRMVSSWVCRGTCPRWCHCDSGPLTTPFTAASLTQKMCILLKVQGYECQLWTPSWYSVFL